VIAPLTSAGVSGSIALARWGDRTVALVADEDDRSIHVVDVARRVEIGVTPLAEKPEQILVARDGRVLVTLRDASQILALEAAGPREATLKARCTVPTPVDPVALAATPDGASFVLTSGWAHAVSVLRASDLAVARTSDVPREPRAVVVSEDGKRAFVSHVLGAGMSVIDLATGQVSAVDAAGREESRFDSTPPRIVGGRRVPDATFRRSSGQGFALAMIGGMIVEPHVLVDPGQIEERSGGYGEGVAGPPHIPDLLMVDEATGAPVPVDRARQADVEALFVRDSRLHEVPPCLLPRAVAANTADGTLLVTCLGSDLLLQFAVDTPAGETVASERHRWEVAAGPTGVAYDPAGQAVVWSKFDGVVDFVPLPVGSMEERIAHPLEPVARLALSRPAGLVAGDDVALGRRLFHASTDPRIARDGRACASCHPDGRDDGLTWSTPDGPRQTPVLAGRLAKTAPYAWSGTNKDFAEHLKNTFQRLGGHGVTPREVDALEAYCNAMAAPAPARASDAEVARGKAIFESRDAACSGCHASDDGARFTDDKHHDVHSAAKADRYPEFDTPSLLDVGGTAPYFHDGRYATLEALLAGTDGTMGHTAQLSPADRDALVAYLRSL
jgi:DNA-binding beta-propeller fold protein YncE